MRKSLPYFLALILIAFAVFLLNCGNDSHAVVPGVSSQFAFIQMSGVSGPSAMSASERHYRSEHPAMFAKAHRRTPGGGLVPWASIIANGTDSVVLMNNDGSGQLVIANQAGYFDAVQEAADGKRGIVLAQDDTGSYQIFYVDLADVNNPKITAVTTVAEDRWSPQISWDGKQVVFVANVSGEGGRAYLLSVSGGTETKIPTTFWVSTPSFTPDGKIIFEQEDNDSISVMNADGTGFKQLTNPDHVYFDEYPGISADGKTIAFARYPQDESSGEDIWVANSDGSNAKQLTTDGLSTDPMFVKDKIVFISARDGLSTTEVYSMNVDGSNQKRLTNDALIQYFDSW